MTSVRASPCSLVFSGGCGSAVCAGSEFATVRAPEGSSTMAVVPFNPYTVHAQTRRA